MSGNRAGGVSCSLFGTPLHSAHVDHASPPPPSPRTHMTTLYKRSRNSGRFSQNIKEPYQVINEPHCFCRSHCAAKRALHPVGVGLGVWTGGRSSPNVPCGLRIRLGAKSDHISERPTRSTRYVPTDLRCHTLCARPSAAGKDILVAGVPLLVLHRLKRPVQPHHPLRQGLRGQQRHGLT